MPWIIMNSYNEIYNEENFDDSTINIYTVTTVPLNAITFDEITTNTTSDLENNVMLIRLQNKYAKINQKQRLRVIPYTQNVSILSIAEIVSAKRTIVYNIVKKW